MKMDLCFIEKKGRGTRIFGIYYTCRKLVVKTG